MLRRFLCLSVGALALLVVLGAPGQLHAQRMRGGMPRGGMPGFHSGGMPGFRGGFAPRSNGGEVTPPLQRGGVHPPLHRGGVSPPPPQRGGCPPPLHLGLPPAFFSPFFVCLPRRRTEPRPVIY